MVVVLNPLLADFDGFDVTWGVFFFNPLEVLIHTGIEPVDFLRLLDGLLSGLGSVTSVSPLAVLFFSISAVSQHTFEPSAQRPAGRTCTEGIIPPSQQHFPSRSWTH